MWNFIAVVERRLRAFVTRVEFGCACVAALAPWIAARAAEPAPRPNVILILTDDMD